MNQDIEGYIEEYNAKSEKIIKEDDLEEDGNEDLDKAPKA